MLTTARATIAAFVFASVTTASGFAQSTPWAAKMFDTQRVDFGVIATGSDAKKLIRIRNLYRETIHISKVDTTCGCSAAKPSRRILGSREEAFIEVTMNTRKFKRRKDSNLIVEFSQPVYGKVTIPITAYIRTDVVLSPGCADFAAVDYGQPAHRRIDIEYAGRNDWRIQEVRVNNPYVVAQVSEKSRRNGKISYTLDVRLQPGLKTGRIRELITLVTDDASNPFVPVLVEGVVEADITVTNSVVALGMMVPGQEKKAQLVLRGKRPFEIEVIECETECDALQFRRPTTQKLIHVIPLTFKAPGVAGQFDRRFLITVAGRPEPLEFSISAMIQQQTVSY